MSRVIQFFTNEEKTPWAPEIFAFVLYGCFLTGYYILFDVSFFLGMETLTSGEGLWQFLPYSLLTDRPLESLLYLHSRPPLGNTLLALGFQLGPGPRLMAFWNHAAGFLIFYYSLRFLIHFCEGRRVAYLLHLVFVYGSSLNFLALLSDILYTFSTAALLTAFAWHGFKFLEAGRKRDLLGSICFVALLSLQRATFGFPFLVLVLGLMIARRGWNRGFIFATGGLPLLAWSVKNYLLLGFFGTTTIAGMTLYWNAGPNVMKDNLRGTEAWRETEQFIKRSHPELAPFLAGTYLKISKYEAGGFEPNKNEFFEQIPALQRHEKEAYWGASNKNAYEYMEVSAAFSQLNRLLILRHPENYLRNCYYAAYQFLKPAWMYRQSVNPVWNTHPHLFEFFRLPHQDAEIARTMRLNVSHGWDMFVYAYFVVLALLFFRFVRPSHRTGRVSALFLLVIIGVGTAAGILVSHLESMRYKFEIEPLVRALFLAWIGILSCSLLERLNERIGRS